MMERRERQLDGVSSAETSFQWYLERVVILPRAADDLWLEMLVMRPAAAASLNEIAAGHQNLMNGSPPSLTAMQSNWMVAAILAGKSLNRMDLHQYRCSKGRKASMQRSDCHLRLSIGKMEDKRVLLPATSCYRQYAVHGP